MPPFRVTSIVRLVRVPWDMAPRVCGLHVQPNLESYFNPTLSAGALDLNATRSSGFQQTCNFRAHPANRSCPPNRDLASPLCPGPRRPAPEFGAWLLESVWETRIVEQFSRWGGGDPSWVPVLQLPASALATNPGLRSNATSPEEGGREKEELRNKLNSLLYLRPQTPDTPPKYSVVSLLFFF